MLKIKKLIAVILAAAVFGSFNTAYAQTLSGSDENITALSESSIKTVISGNATKNLSANNYTVWSSTVKSYIAQNSDGTFTRAGYSSDGTFYIEKYSKDFVLLSSKTISPELPVFGGFYSSESYFFLVFGRNNFNDDENAEVMRIVKYDKDMNRLDSAEIYGANTYIPFDAGSLRMTDLEGKLYIYTCHEMFASDDGLHHQANMTFVVDISSMEITDSFYDVMNISYGYISHSFNQFIKTDGEHIYRADHGDAYPRALSITKVNKDDSVTEVQYAEVFTIQGYAGNNATGVSVGGFELSENNCLLAGNSVDQSDSSSYYPYGQRNIFLSVTSKNLTKAKTVWLTDYDGSENITPNTPVLVKLSDNGFLVMWEEYSSTGYLRTKMVTVNGNGDFITDVVSTSLRLSDCQPIFTTSGNVVWYAADGEEAVMYSIDPYNLSSAAEEPENPDETTKPDDTTKPGQENTTRPETGSLINGDLNGDGKITAADARITLRAAASLEILSDEQKKAADVDLNGRITASDARKILRAAAGLEKL